MQKSKNITIAIIIFILIYGLFANLKLVFLINRFYLYIINPIFWIALAVTLRIALGKNIEQKKIKKQIIQYTIIAVLVYIIVNMLSGLFITFGINPYNTTLIGLFHNLWIFGTVIIAKEYIRFYLVNNVYDKYKIKIAILISIVYILIDINIYSLLVSSLTPIFIVKFFAQTVLPAITENILFSYTAIYSSYLPAILYKGLTNLYYWISPIIPNSPWIMTSIINSSIPLILFMYIRYIKNKLDIFRNRANILNSDPRNIIPLIIVIILSIWFAVGIFPVKPVAIASGSMERELYIGDIAIIKKCKSNDINVGDIIEYKMEGYTVIHRVIEKKQKNGEFYFITKGDNNKSPDAKEVTENQLIGKVIFKIKYLGYPAIWLHLIQENEQLVEVETGN